MTANRARPGQALRASEDRVMQMIADGHTIDDTAERLGISRATVTTYLQAARTKLRARNTVHAVALWATSTRWQPNPADIPNITTEIVGERVPPMEMALAQSRLAQGGRTLRAVYALGVKDALTAIAGPHPKTAAR